jgi:hypothetical protein
MNKTILIIRIEKRKDTAVMVQKILSEWGCLIKTRLGIHDGVLDDCSDDGLVFLELVGEEDKKNQLDMLLANLPGVKTKLINI